MKRRLRVVRQPKVSPPLTVNVENITNVNQNSVEVGFLENLQSRFLLIVMVAFIVALLGLYYAYRLIRRYLLSKDLEAVIHLVHPSKPTVGETLTCRIRFKHKGGKFIPSSSTTFHELEANLSIEPHLTDLTRPIAVLKEFNKRNSYIAGKFSVRRAGSYGIKVKYDIFDLSVENPFVFEVFPGPVSPHHLDFETHNPSMLCLTAEFHQYFKILTNDEYGNKCQMQDVDLSKFGFGLFLMGSPIPVEHEFCYHKSRSSGSFDDGSESSESETGACFVSVCLKLRIDQPGIYTCLLRYDEFEVQSAHGVPKLVICITQDEERELRTMFSKVNIVGTLMFTNECKLSIPDQGTDFVDYYTGMSSNSLVFAYYRIPLQLYPDIHFPINGRTKIALVKSTRTTDVDEEIITLQVQDGLRASVKVEMSASSGRMFLIVFAHNQGFILSKRSLSFEEKRDGLKFQLSSIFALFRSERILRVNPGNLVNTTKSNVPIDRSDWLLPFQVRFEGSGQTASSKIQVEQWVGLLCGEFFQRQSETAMFQRLHGSKLLHPVSASISHQPLENYRLAGQILAKAAVETLLRGICTQLSHVKFSRSLLSFVLGYPISFKFLEVDDPKYFQKIMQVVDANLTGNEYTFTTKTSSNANTSINLIPNGCNIPVTNTNKEHYLNMLTRHRLIHTVEQEITAFRNGFYDVIDKDNLSDFLEDDLQKLISGGYKFKVADLKAHHRVVKEVYNGSVNALTIPAFDSQKVLHWFWIAVENLSEEEQASLMFFATGSFSLPSCGLAHLNPLFTISLTGTFNQPPQAHPVSNEIVLGDHTCFDSFERSLLYAIKPESERIMLPSAVMICLLEQCGENSSDIQETVVEYEENGEAEVTRPQDAVTADPILTWLRGFMNI